MKTDFPDIRLHVIKMFIRLSYLYNDNSCSWYNGIEKIPGLVEVIWKGVISM